MQLHDPYGIGKLSISSAKTCNFSSVGCDKKNLRLPIRQFERKISSLEMALFFIPFLPYLSGAPYLQYAPAIPVCIVYYNRTVSARQKSECRGLLDPRNTWMYKHEQRLSLLDTDRSQKSTIHERSVRTERQEGLLTDRLTIDFFA